MPMINSYKSSQWRAWSGMIASLACGLAVLLIVSSTAGLFAQKTSVREAIVTLDEGEYRKVLRGMFPKAVDADRGAIFTIRVLILPGSGPESMITIVQQRGMGTAIYQHADRDIRETITEGLRAGMNSETAARKVHVVTEQLGFSSAQLFELQRSFLAAVTSYLEDTRRQSRRQFETGSVEVMLDAGNLEIDYQQGLSQVSLAIPDAASTSEHALMKWASLLSDLVKAASTSQRE